ncbi:MAG: DUF2946 family protein [Pseudoxanthomonas sp.]
MLRNATLQRLMARLALVAVLLLAFAPVMSRWMKGDALQFLPGLSEICTTSGLKSIDVSGWGSEAPKLPGAGHLGMDADCGYCTLLAGTALLLLAVALLSPPALSRDMPAWQLLPVRMSSIFPGLGSRGPPLAL